MDPKILYVFIILGMIMIATGLLYTRIMVAISSTNNGSYGSGGNDDGSGSSGSSGGSGGSGDGGDGGSGDNGGGDNWPPPAIYYYYIVVEGYFDSSSGDGHISSIYVDVVGEPVDQMKVGEGSDHVDVYVYYNGERVKTKTEYIGTGSLKVYLDVTEYKGKTVTVKAWLIDERIGAYGTPNPVIVDEKEVHLQIPSYS